MSTVRDSDSALGLQHESGSVSHQHSVPHQDGDQQPAWPQGLLPGLLWARGAHPTSSPGGRPRSSPLQLEPLSAARHGGASARRRLSGQPRPRPLPTAEEVPGLVLWVPRVKRSSRFPVFSGALEAQVSRETPAPAPPCPEHSCILKHRTRGSYWTTVIFSHHLAYMFKEQKQQDHHLDN